MAKVIEMTRLTGTPSRGATNLSHEMARMAMPIMVRRTMKSRITIKTSDSAMMQHLERRKGDAADSPRDIGEELRDLLGIRAQGQGEVLQEKTDAERGDDGRDAGRLPQRLVGCPLDQHADAGNAEHGEEQRRNEREPEQGRENEAEKCAHHEEIAMGEVDHGEDAVDHGVAEGDQGIDAPELQRIQNLLEEIGHQTGLSSVTQCLPVRIRGDEASPCHEAY